MYINAPLKQTNKQRIMRILFLCVGVNPWRSLIAKKVMKSFDDDLEVFASQLNEEVVLNDNLKSVMTDLGFSEDDFDIQIYSDLQNIDFDYLITLSSGTMDALKKFHKNYKRKLHLEFTSQKDLVSDDVNSVKILKRIQSEFEGELDYFYHHILTKKAAK